MTPAKTKYVPSRFRSFEVFLAFLRLGLTSFGGPVAHLGYFREEFVGRRKWLDEQSYADLVALCQFLPGPASSQVGMALGMSRAGMWGALAAWAGFTLPSAIVLVLLGLGVSGFGDLGQAGWLRGLKLVAVAVVAQAVMGMARSLTPDRPRALLAMAAAVAALLVPGAFVQVGIILVAGLIGWRFLESGVPIAKDALPVSLSRGWGLFFLGLFFALLLALPILREVIGGPVLALLDSFYRAGALVFGGGHVVLPLLEAQVVPTGWVSHDAFLAGYGATQAMPGPLLTFSAYLGAVSHVGLPSLLAASIALIGIFLPAFLLVAGSLPFWSQIRQQAGVRAALQGINAAVVGILLAALYSPVFTSAVDSARDFAFAIACFALLEYLKLPPWLVVLLSALIGALVS